jgi:hypothetical protein
MQGNLPLYSELTNNQLPESIRDFGRLVG